MTVAEYFAEIKALVDRYAGANFVISANVTLDVRPGEQGFLSGTVSFTDNTVLYFREFIDVVGDALHKVMYSYHYQRLDGTMIFRYDNARHRAQVEQEEHKHIGEQFILMPAPALVDVLAEVSALGGWVK